ncbi:hypothetical protein BGZ65_010823, partial [Modicella reniformis]
MSAMRPEDIKEAFDLFDPKNTGKIEPAAFENILRNLGDEELKRSIRIPDHPIDFKEFSDIMNRYNHDNTQDPEEAYRRVFKAAKQGLNS